MSKRRPTERTPTRRRLLKSAAGVTAVAAFVPTASGLTAAHFPNELDIFESCVGLDVFLRRFTNAT